METTVKFGPGYTQRGESAARAYRLLRDALTEINVWDARYPAKAARVAAARKLMRAYGFQLDDEGGM